MFATLTEMKAHAMLNLLDAPGALLAPCHQLATPSITPSPSHQLSSPAPTSHHLSQRKRRTHSNRWTRSSTRLRRNSKSTEVKCQESSTLETMRMTAMLSVLTLSAILLVTNAHGAFLLPLSQLAIQLLTPRHFHLPCSSALTLTNSPSSSKTKRKMRMKRSQLSSRV